MKRIVSYSPLADFVDEGITPESETSLLSCSIVDERLTGRSRKNLLS
jgi:hypothetical protein